MFLTVLDRKFRNEAGYEKFLQIANSNQTGFQAKLKVRFAFKPEIKYLNFMYPGHRFISYKFMILVQI